jgi:hypothetical protein
VPVAKPRAPVRDVDRALFEKMAADYESELE